MKYLNSLFIALIFLTSCGGETESELELKMLPSENAYILPTNGYLCHDSTIVVSSPRIDYKQLEITWKGVQPLDISFLQLEFNDYRLGGEYVCTVDEYELEILFGGLPERLKIPAPQGPQYDPVTVTSRTNCSLRCGSIPVQKEYKDKPFKIKGNLVLFGTSLKEDGTDYPVKSKIPITMENY